MIDLGVNYVCISVLKKQGIEKLISHLKEIAGFLQMRKVVLSQGVGTLMPLIELNNH